ncbi:hypothetical protein DEJ49_35855 [Streptomyces venezuelae]|uniref:Uncharacterized protein n=1 Tax=Streptomyces venezuelae TaxID=54571 RepID=A0A5P2CAT8_STRVZ|nr:hypothetical protein DEJ49_00700 [Streptomyces venezuelae]QES45651.1 hypothetical protein DEJ49_35855 [Streptomyces venezuelae]
MSPASARCWPAPRLPGGGCVFGAWFRAGALSGRGRGEGRAPRGGPGAARPARPSRPRPAPSPLSRPAPPCPVPPCPAPSLPVPPLPVPPRPVSSRFFLSCPWRGRVLGSGLLWVRWARPGGRAWGGGGWVRGWGCRRVGGWAGWVGWLRRGAGVARRW